MNKTALTYVHEGYADWELGYVLPELVKAGYAVTSASVDGKAVKSMGGLTVQPDLPLTAAAARGGFAVVVLPGGDSWNDQANHREILALLPPWRGRGTLVAGICGAVIGLARTGMLDTVKHTSNYLPLTRQLAPGYAGAALHSQRLAECDQGVVTASGIGALEFTCEVLKALNVFDDARAAEWFDFHKHAIPPARMLAQAQG